MVKSFNSKINPLNKHHDRKAFSCGKAALDNYLQKLASQDLKRRTAVTYILEGNKETEIAGYYTLSSFSIDPGKLTEKEKKILPKKRPVPCTLLGQFAIDNEHQGQGLAALMLVEIFYKVIEQSKKIGSYALIVDAIDTDAVSFWLHYGFIPFPSTENRLFLPMKTIGQWLK